MTRRRNRRKKKSEVSSEMLVGMDDIVFESFSLETNVPNKKLKIPANLFYQMLETMRIDETNREFIQELKELTMLLTVDYTSILIDNYSEIVNLYFELANLIDKICRDKASIEKNREMAKCLMDLYPFIMETIKNKEYLLIYSAKLPKNAWD